MLRMIPTCSADSEKGIGFPLMLTEEMILAQSVTASQPGGGKSQDLGLLRDQGHVVVVTIVNSEKEEVLQAEDVVGEEDAVVCLANAGYPHSPEIDSKL